jgi:hypothetical protein
LAALVTILPLVAAQGAVGAPPAPTPSVSELAVTAVANPSDLDDAEYQALAKFGPRTPHYSLEQMASFLCRTRAISRVRDFTGAAKTAYDATKAFDETKDAVRAGRAGFEDLVRAESTRQLAVQGLMTELSIPVQGVADIGPATSGGLAIENVKFRFGNLGGQSIIRIHGELRNSGSRGELAPLITASALDHFGIVLAQQGYGSPHGIWTIPAHSVRPIDYIFPDAPQYTHEVKMTFGPPDGIRNRRDCGEVKPFKAPGQTLDVPRSGDAVQAALDDAAATPLRAEMVLARSIKTDSGRELQVTGSIHNTSATDVIPLRLSIFIKDVNGNAIGEAEIGLKGKVLAGDVTPFNLVVEHVSWILSDKGQGSLDQMKTVSVLVD